MSGHTAATLRGGQAGAEGTWPEVQTRPGPRRVGRAGSTLGCDDGLQEAGTSGAHRCRTAWLPEKLGPASLLRRSPRSCPTATIRSPLSSKWQVDCVVTLLEGHARQALRVWAELLSGSCQGFLRGACPNATHVLLHLKRTSRDPLAARGALPNIMCQRGWERGLGEDGHTDTHG